VSRFVLGTTTVVAIAAAALVVGGCAFRADPTEDNFYVRIRNDTSSTVILGECGTGDDLCTKLYATGRVRPGGSWPSVQTSVGLTNPVLVRNSVGQRLGCLPLLFDYNADGTAVRVSEAMRCAKGYSARPNPTE